MESIGIDKDERESILVAFSKKLPELSCGDLQSDRSVYVREWLESFAKK